MTAPETRTATGVKLIVCSNSAPRWQDGAGLLPRSPGGLVPLLATLLGEHGGDWVCTMPADGPQGAEPVETTRLPGDVTLHRLRLPPATVEQHYEGIGVRVLLWLFHYLLDTARQPGEGLAEAWSGYEAVNRAYADRVASLMTGSPDEFVLVNDHHLFLVPEMLRRRADRRGRVAFFQGLPWCEPEYFGVLPASIRDRVLAGLLCADVVGFHCTRWARAFLACCARYLPGCAVDEDGATFDGHRTRVTVAPFPLDVAMVERLRGEPATAEWRARLDRDAGGRRMIARADRIDLWKNLPRGFAAYRSLLDRDPGLAEEWWFCAVATPPGRPTERTRDLRRECEETVADLNERFGAPGRPAVSLIYPDLATTRNCVVAALSRADLTLVNPTFDGMNLVAKEALYLGERGPLLLSVNAGAYEGLAGHVTPVHPFDVEATASALRDAMTCHTTPAERAAARRLLRDQDATDWLNRMMGAER
ncbi:trehalose-6-phosphate synthase [Actinoallomurus rhizosphaericola]|uniref:trehalose-6-phosphate synthase n=1 Tax=Actinoallomurus rhizosphaericola TaxID=2952536 RepID=UPI0020937908|nr:trehalose-6-phosphate synthase [Actinoallomurus rhizosphaericola]MCO5995922.1 trehalose-6-phosphate synthase [Actinoallomurus rhizosphaericola]